MGAEYLVLHGQPMVNLLSYNRYESNELRTKCLTALSSINGQGSLPIVKISTHEIENAQTSIAGVMSEVRPDINSGACQRKVPT